MPKKKPVERAGEEFHLTPENVLGITGPKNMRGPHQVVHIQHTDRWALVTMEWWIDGYEAWKPCLGLRWFYGNSGYPIGFAGAPVWMVIPSELSRSILDNILISPRDRAEIDDFLSAEWASE